MTTELSTAYLGLKLETPIIVGACPLTLEPEKVRQMVDAGAGAVVLPSILQEQLDFARLKDQDPDGAVQRSGYQPQQDEFNGGPTAYLQTLAKLKDCCSVPVLANLSGTSRGSWLQFANEVEANGADAIELNWRSGVTGPTESSDHIESRLLDLVKDLRQRVTVPIAVKLTQHFTNLSAVASKLEKLGVDGLILFAHRPHWDVCVDRMQWNIRWELTPQQSLGAILEGIVHARTGAGKVSIAASGGIRTGEDAVKAMVAGADAVMIASEIYRAGPDAIRNILQGIRAFLDASRFQSLAEFLADRPAPDLCSDRLMHMEYVDPMIRSSDYPDPTPAPTHGRCDSFGHRIP